MESLGKTPNTPEAQALETHLSESEMQHEAATHEALLADMYAQNKRYFEKRIEELKKEQGSYSDKERQDLTKILGYLVSSIEEHQENVRAINRIGKLVPYMSDDKEAPKVITETRAQDKKDDMALARLIANETKIENDIGEHLHHLAVLFPNEQEAFEKFRDEFSTRENREN